MATVTFDFDLTLTTRPTNGTAQVDTPNRRMLTAVRLYAARGYRVVIVTGRSPENESKAWIAANYPGSITVTEFVERHALPVAEVVYTRTQLKGPVLAALGSARHYDDDPQAVASARSCGVRTTRVLPRFD